MENTIKDAKSIAEVNQIMWQCNNLLKVYSSKKEMIFLNREIISEIISFVKYTRNQKGQFQAMDLNGIRYVIEVDRIRDLIDWLDIDTLINKHTTKLYDTVKFKQNKLDKYLLKSSIRSVMWKLFDAYPNIIQELKEIGYETIKQYLESSAKQLSYSFFYLEQYLDVIAECL